MLANLQQQQFQSGLVLSQQAQQFNQAATQAALTGWYTPPPGVPSVQQWLGGASNAPPGQGVGGTGGQTTGTPGNPSWDQLSQAMQQAAGANYNDAAAKSLFNSITGWNGGGSPANLSQQQLDQIVSAGTNGTIGSYAGLAPAPANAPTAPAAAPGTPVQTEAAREFNANLGQQYLATAAQLQGPQNTFQLSNYLRGAQANPNVPVYLQNLAQGVGQNLFVAPGQNAPTTQSAAGLVGQLGGNQSATPGWDYNQTLGTIQNIMSAGAQRLGPGALENLTPDELQALGSGIGAAGGTLPSFLQQYAQSRVGQTAPVRQTALA